MQNRNEVIRERFASLRNIIESGAIAASSTAAFVELFKDVDLTNFMELGTNTDLLTELVKTGLVITSGMVTGNLFALSRPSFFSNPHHFLLSNFYSFVAVSEAFIVSKALEAVADIDPSFAVFLSSFAVAGSVLLPSLFLNLMEQSFLRNERYARNV